MIDGPVGKDGAPVDEAAADRSKNARIVRTDAVIPHDEVTVRRHAHWSEIAQVLVLRRNVRLGHDLPIDVDGALPNFHRFARQTDHALYEGFRMIERIPEHDHIPTVNGLEAVDKLIDENAFLVGEQRSHAGAFDFYRLVQEDDNDQRKTDGDQEVAGPDANFAAQGVQRRGWFRSCNGR